MTSGRVEKGNERTRIGLAVRKRWPGNLDSRISERATEDPRDRSRQRVCAPPGSIGKGAGYAMRGRTGHRSLCRVSWCSNVVLYGDCVHRGVGQHGGRRMGGSSRLGGGSANPRHGADL